MSGVAGIAQLSSLSSQNESSPSSHEDHLTSSSAHPSPLPSTVSDSHSFQSPVCPNLMTSAVHVPPHLTSHTHPSSLAVPFSYSTFSINTTSRAASGQASQPAPFINPHLLVSPFPLNPVAQTAFNGPPLPPNLMPPPFSTSQPFHAPPASYTPIATPIVAPSQPHPAMQLSMTAPFPCVNSGTVPQHPAALPAISPSADSPVNNSAFVHPPIRPVLASSPSEVSLVSPSAIQAPSVQAGPSGSKC